MEDVVLIQLFFLNYVFNLFDERNSVRATLEETKVNMAYRWFLGLGVNSTVPNHSTFSQNYIRRYSGTDVFDKVFTTIVTKIVEKRLIDTNVIFVDGAHIKANANKHKSIKCQVRMIADKYHQALEKEVDKFRELNGRDKYHSDDDQDGYTIDDKTVDFKK